jgi:predicted ATP-binding protein involved in virulence
MFLRRIHLENFRCFSDLELDFGNGSSNRKHTLVLGENGTGKSNLLKAIGLVTSGSSALGELLGEARSWIQNGKRDCLISATITTAQNQERNLSLVIRRSDTLATLIQNNKESLSQIDSALNYSQRSYFVLALGASRRLTSKSRNKSPENFYETRRANNVATLFNRDASLNSLENWAIDLDYRKDRRGLDIVKSSFRACLPGASFHRIDKKSRQLIFKTADGLVPLEFLSDGYQNMASWLGDLLFRVTSSFENYRDPMKARGLLLIDEIDLHLHPSWQRQLLEFFKSKLPYFQLIATTHSPLTAQQAGEEELYALVRHKKNIQLVPFVGAPNKMLVGQLLMSPIFGLNTDESTHVEQIKNRYRKLRDTPRRSRKDKAEFSKLSMQVKSFPISARSNSLLSPKQLQLISEFRFQPKRGKK